MGSAEIDLREALIPSGESDLEVICLFGNAQITVPPGVRVTKEGAAFAGSFEITGGAGTLPDTAPLIRIRGTVYFGSVDVSVGAADD
jgi:predicted membrane protein